ncbi:hypothetical protein [Microbacterium sp. P05]|uniref:hypothetical protein n=1 Tax=Microbacterium sp. P05 TaxID=3366948 RepID=UPI00374501E0
MSTTERPGAGVVWARVEDGFHVASRDGEFLGYIEQVKGEIFVACDKYSRTVGKFDDLPAAMRAVTTANSLVERPTR